MIKSYAVNLPRKITKGRCQVLNMDGDLCNKPAVQEITYHGDSEIYNYDWVGCKAMGKKWVAIKVCKEHSND